MIRARIAGTGSYVPKKVLSNLDLEKIVDTTDEWITTRTGIKERRIADACEATSDIAKKAALIALDNAKLKIDDLQLIIVATITPDMFFPSTACFVQYKLGAKNAAAFDINAACSGFIYGLSIANLYIKSGEVENVLLIGAETLSRVVDYEDRTTCILFGDGAGAAVIKASEGNSGIISTRLYSDGSYHELLNLPGGGSKFPSSHETVNDRMHFMKMKGNEVFKIAVRVLSDSALTILTENGYTSNDVNLFIPHQANNRIITAIAKRLGITDDKMFLNIEKYGNTSAASVAIALDEAVQQGLIKESDLILFSAFGGGLTWGSALIQW